MALLIAITVRICAGVVACISTTVRKRTLMPKCGICGWSFSDRTLSKHAYTVCGQEQEKALAYSPELDDLIKQEEESK